MSRQRKPVARIAPSPAAQRPENQAVEARARSGRELQEQIRTTEPVAPAQQPVVSTAKTAETPAVEPAALPTNIPATPPAKAAEQKIAKRTDRAPTKPKPLPDFLKGPAETPDRLDIYWPANAEMQSKIAAMASQYGRDVTYIEKALVKAARQDLAAFDSKTIQSFKNDAALLLEQQGRGETKPTRHRIPTPMSALDEMYMAVNDPLKALTPNKIVAAFYAAAIWKQLKTA